MQNVQYTLTVRYAEFAVSSLCPVYLN